MTVNWVKIYRHSTRPTVEDNSGFSSQFLLLSIRISALLYKQALGTAVTTARTVHKFKGSLLIADGFKDKDRMPRNEMTSLRDKVPVKYYRMGEGRDDNLVETV